MRLKIHTGSHCPNCGRSECAERVRRSRLIRVFLPGTKLMKCRLCWNRFLVRRARA